MINRATIAKRGKWIRVRETNPELFDKRSFRNKTSNKHILTFACPVGKYNVSTEKCDVNVELQAIFHPMKEYYKFCKKGQCPVKET